jgi:hypothetical protein
VHASVQDIEVCQQTDEARTPPRKRVEYAHFDVGMLVERQEARVDVVRQRVIHEQAHARAAVGRFGQV